MIKFNSELKPKNKTHYGILRCLPIWLLLICTFLSSCGNNSSQNFADSFGDGSAQNLTGSFVDSPVKGLTFYASPSGLTGTTDASGSFTYRIGDVVEFRLNLGATSLTIGYTSSPSAITSVLTIVPPSGGSTLSIAQILQTLDVGTASNTIDVSNLSQIPDFTIPKIRNALMSISVSSSDIAGIASDITTAGIKLKNGSSGVSTASALSHLSQNVENNDYIKGAVEKSLTNDGSLFGAIYDKPFFSVWVSTENSKASTMLYFGQFTSTRNYDFQSPISAQYLNKISGALTPSSDCKSSSYTPSSGVKFTFNIISADMQSTILSFFDSSTSVSGIVTGQFLQQLEFKDMVSKQILFSDMKCKDSLNLVTIDSFGVQSQTCYIGSSILIDGPYKNTLQSTDANGYFHNLGLIKLSKPNDNTENLPIGSTGTFVEFDYSNNTGTPRYLDFIVRSLP